MTIPFYVLKNLRYEYEYSNSRVIEIFSLATEPVRRP